MIATSRDIADAAYASYKEGKSFEEVVREVDVFISKYSLHALTEAIYTKLEKRFIEEKDLHTLKIESATTLSGLQVAHTLKLTPQAIQTTSNPEVGSGFKALYNHTLYDATAESIIAHTFNQS